MRRMILALLAFVFAGAAPTAHAQATLSQSDNDRAAPRYVWRNVAVGGGGFIPNIVFSEAERGLAYARSDMGGAYRWDEEAGAWIPLQDAVPQSGYFGIESLALDPRDASTLYLAAGMYRGDEAAILRSRDRGASWEVFPVNFRMGGNEDGRGLGERLAVSPHNPRILYFGSRHDGLQRSADGGQTWSRVENFPVRGRGLPAAGQPTNAGLSFVLFDPRPNVRTVIVASADPGPRHLFRSDDDGASWAPITGGPRPGLLPLKGALSPSGDLYITFGDGVGPNGITDGAVYKYNLDSRQWTDITPPRGEGGFMGLSLERQTPGALVVSTINRWNAGDTIWRSLDAGRTWTDLRPASSRDVSATPFLYWGEAQAHFGWWIAGLAVDPFDSAHIAYATGATIYATRELGQSSLLWKPWVQGIEQTAVITLTSPSAGVPLLSGFGDISGFAHEDLARSPALQFTNPLFANTNTIDYAALAPNVIVRSGTPPHRARGGDPTLAFSSDGGRSWSPLALPPLRWTDADGASHEDRFDLRGDTAIAVSADGGAFIAMTPTPMLTRDRGATWAPLSGLPLFSRIVTDRANPHVFYLLDFNTGRLFITRDGGETFSARRVRGLPENLSADRPSWREAPWPLHATPGHVGHLWLVSRQGLFRSADHGASFARIDGGVHVEMLSFGASPPGRAYPALYAIGWRGEARAIFRSDDEGASWIRLNDAAHEYGGRFRAIAGDPRIFGRVYVGTDGRGIVYGEPAAAR